MLLGRRRRRRRRGGRCGFCRSGSQSRRRRCAGRGRFLLFCASIVCPYNPFGVGWALGMESMVHTSSRPHPHRRTQNHLSPIQPRTLHTPQRAQHARPRRLHSAHCRCRISRPDTRQIQTQRCTREICKRAREVIEALALSDY